MKRGGLLLLALATALSTTYLCGQEMPNSAWGKCFSSTEPAQCELKAGVDSYKNARYQDAVMHLRRSVVLDSKNSQAHLYLASAFAQQFIPGVETPDNVRFGEQAIAEYSVVLQQGTQDKSDPFTAAHGIAELYFQMKKFDDAKKYYRQLIDIDPKNPEPYFSIAVIDWTVSYTARMKAYAKLDIKPEVGRLDIGTCLQLADEHKSEVDEAMEMLVKALELRPDYDDAMAYMNLVYRERADLHCNDEKARKADLVKADEWVDATLATKKAKMEQAQKAQAGKQ